MNFSLHFQIAAIRAFGGDDIKSVTRRAWKETMADSLMSQKSSLAKTVFVKFVLVT